MLTLSRTLTLFVALVLPSVALADRGGTAADAEALAIYKQAVSAPEVNAPQPRWSAGNVLKALAMLNTPFDHKGRTMPEGKLKLVHGGDKTQAAMGVLRFVPSANNGMQGFFGKGGLVVARASATIPWAKKSFGPGISIMRPGVGGEQPLNGFFLQSLTGQGKDRNYFAHSMSNDIRPTKLLGRAFYEALNVPIRAYTWRPFGNSPLGQQVGFMRADQFAMSFDAQGNGKPTDPALQKVELRPTASARSIIASDSKNPLATDLAKVKTGTVTHQVFADGKLVGHFEVVKPFVGTQHRFHVRHPRGRPGSRYSRRR
ncbi:MAG: hypothetical protein KC503_42785 [Myxococcales bacterium]|nr:hypothetical protein [Myxococcales bacterium]